MNTSSNIKRMHLVKIIALLATFSFSSMATANEINRSDFKRAYASDQLEIDFLDKDDELFIRTKVRARINNASLAQAKELIFDLSQITKWLGGVKEAKVIERYSPDRQKGVLINRMPFPLSEREVVILLEVASADEHHIALKMSSDYTGMSLNEKYVRVEPYVADLILTKQGDDVIFELSDFYNPKVSALPEFTVVSHLKSISYDTIENVSELKF